MTNNQWVENVDNTFNVLKALRENGIDFTYNGKISNIKIVNSNIVIDNGVIFASDKLLFKTQHYIIWNQKGTHVKKKVDVDHTNIDNILTFLKIIQ